MESPELTTQSLVVIGLLLALAGVALGWALGRRTASASRKYREVERKLDQVLKDQKNYEDEVVEHFTETAKLLNSLTDSYRDVHNHLARGAGTLCHGRGPVSLEDLDSDPAEIPANLAYIQQPLDYAPRTSPDQKGMLNEEFGLERKQPEQESSAPART